MTEIEKRFAHLLDSNPAFFHFVNDTFNDIAGATSPEDLAEFAFGSLEEAIEAYEKFKGKASD